VSVAGGSLDLQPGDDSAINVIANGRNTGTKRRFFIKKYPATGAEVEIKLRIHGIITPLLAQAGRNFAVQELVIC
jgi:hypothetical protein